jgi:hypothetical protein
MSEQPPDFFTIEEAAAVLRLGRTAAYRLANIHLATGENGLPCKRIGHQLRVPRYELEELLGGPVTWPPPAKAKAARTQALEPEVQRLDARPTRRTASAKRTGNAQTRLPFGA